MYIAMNRFQVKKDRTEAFEDMWKTRESHLNEMDGFRTFQLLKGPEHEDYILYASHTVWSSYEDFEGWTHSDAFKKSHSRAGGTSEPVTMGHPVFEGFEVILNEENTDAAVA